MKGDKKMEILKRTWNNAVTNESTLNFNLDMFAYSSRDPEQNYEKNKNTICLCVYESWRSREESG